MKMLLDYNPLTQQSCVFQLDAATNRLTITHQQDVSKALKKAAHLRSDPNHIQHQMKEDLIHYAIIPEVIQLDMKERFGVDFWNRDHAAKVYELVNTEYKAFKTTEITHSLKKWA